jgi:hypothetical protein
MVYANPDAVTQIANGLSTTTFSYDNIRAGSAGSLRAIANALNVRRIGAPRGGTWAAAQVRDLLGRIKQPVIS